MESNSKSIPENFDCYTEVVCLLGSTRLARQELNKVIDSGIDVKLDKDIGEAFMWSETPQGHNFWSDLVLGARLKKDAPKQASRIYVTA